MCNHETKLGTSKIIREEKSRIEIEAECAHCEETICEFVLTGGMASYMPGGGA